VNLEINCFDLVDERQAATLLGVSPGTLSVWRSTGRYSIPFVKIGSRIRRSGATA
jgi:DNA-binding transcriptional regulator YdaS (Cro superfamily)